MILCLKLEFKPYWLLGNKLSVWLAICGFGIVQVDKSCVHEVQRKRKSSRRSHYDVRSVDDITEEDLENIAYRSKDKIWDKENVSHSRHLHICCSQVSWVCVVPHCVLVDVPSGQLVSPVQTEDPGH